MQPTEAEALLKRLMAATKGWTKESSYAFMDQLVERQERIASVAVQECIDTYEWQPTWSQFKALYDKEARRTAQDSDSCAICAGSGWQEVAPDRARHQMDVRECRCRIRP